MWRPWTQGTGARVWPAALALALLAGCGGGGGGTSPPPIEPFWLSTGLVVADLDGDGRDDVAMNNLYVSEAFPAQGFVDIWRQTTPGHFGPLVRHGVAPMPWPLVAADVSGDGRPDLLSVSPITDAVDINAITNSGMVSVLRQSTLAPGQFEPAQLLATGGAANGVAVSDVHGDGLADLLVADGVIANNRALLLSQLAPGGSFGVPVPVCAGVGMGWAALAVGDIDGDGQRDLAGAGGSLIWWCRGQAGGSFGAPTVIGSGIDFYALELADLDADGRLDFVAADAGNAPAGGVGGSALRWWLQTAPGLFFLQTQALADGAQSLVVRDLDQDGRLDLAVLSTVYQTQSNSTRITVLLQSQATAGAFAVTQVWEGPMLGSFIAAGEVTGDGRIDLVVNGPVVYPQSPAAAGSFLPGTALP